MFFKKMSFKNPFKRQKNTEIDFVPLPKIHYLHKDNKNSKSSQRRVIKRGLILKLMGIVLLLLFIPLIFFQRALFKIQIQEIKLENVHCTTENSLRKTLQSIQGTIYLFNQITYQEKIQKNYPCIKSVVVTKSFPNKLTVTFSGRKPTLLLDVYEDKRLSDFTLEEASPSSQTAILNLNFDEEATSTGTLVVDGSGYVFQSASPDSNLPRILTLRKDLKEGYQFQIDEMMAFTEVLQKLDELILPINKIKLLDTILIVNSDMEILFSLNKEMYRQLASLQLILQEAKMNSRQIERIDLRFSKPVVVYSNHSNGKR